MTIARFLDENDYTCDCVSLWLWELIRSKPAVGTGPRCARPQALTAYSLQQITREDDLCRKLSLSTTDSQVVLNT